MARGKELKAVSYISVDGGPPVAWDSLTAEKRAEYTARIMENIGKTLSGYLSANPQEAAPLLKSER